MNKDVIISVRGTQATEDQEVNELELVTEGKMYKKGETYYVSYDESDLTGMEGTTTTLKVGENGVVTLIRYGSVNTQFVFEKGQKHMSHYDTSYGTFTVSVLASKVTAAMDDEGGEIQVDYKLEIDNAKAGFNDFYLKIQKITNSSEQEYLVNV